MSAKESLKQLKTIFICLQNIDNMSSDEKLKKYGTDGVRAILEAGYMHLEQIESEMRK